MSEPTTTAAPSPVDPRRKLSAELHALNVHFGHEEVHLGKLIDVLGDRTYSLMVVLMTLPLFTPATLLGIALAIGPVVTALGLGLACGLHPSRLPEKLRNRRLPPRFFGALLRGAEKIIRFLERITRKRLPFFVTGPTTRRLIGGGIMIAALLLMLPAPLSNGPPATAMVCLAMGLLEEDGAMVLVGFIALVASMVYFAVLGFFGAEVFEFLRHWFALHFNQSPPSAPPVAP